MSDPLSNERLTILIELFTQKILQLLVFMSFQVVVVVLSAFFKDENIC